MSLRTSKQIIYGALFLLFWIAALSLVYRFSIRPEPSCFDFVQNQSEEGIDCGGPCARKCLPAGLKPIRSVDRVLILRPTREAMTILGRVSNPNTDLAAKSFTYTFMLLGFDGGVVQSFSGKSFIYAGEVKHLLVPNVPYPAAAFSHSELRISEEEWVPKNELPGPPNVATLGTETKSDGKNLVVSGQVVNRDTKTLSRISLIAVFRGRFGQTAGVSQTEAQNLAPNESRSFSILHPAIQNVDLAGTSVFVYAR